jgi:hypothetical protein
VTTATTHVLQVNSKVGYSEVPKEQLMKSLIATQKTSRLDEREAQQRREFVPVPKKVPSRLRKEFAIESKEAEQRSPRASQQLV